MRPICFLQNMYPHIQSFHEPLIATFFKWASHYIYKQFIFFKKISSSFKKKKKERRNKLFACLKPGSQRAGLMSSFRVVLLYPCLINSHSKNLSNIHGCGVVVKVSDMSLHIEVCKVIPDLQIKALLQFLFHLPFLDCDLRLSPTTLDTLHPQQLAPPWHGLSVWKKLRDVRALHFISLVFCLRSWKLRLLKKKERTF